MVFKVGQASSLSAFLSYTHNETKWKPFRNQQTESLFYLGAVALKSAACETITIHRPPRLAITKL
jgi:hypothetical protein